MTAGLPGPAASSFSAAGERPAAPILRTSELTKRFGGLVAVDQVDLSVGRRAVTSIVGPNGAGKTTLFNLISGVIRPDSGRVEFDGADVSGWSATRLARAGLARTFQNVRLFPNLTVLENVMIGCCCHAGAGVVDSLLLIPRHWRQRARLRDRARAMLELVGIGGQHSRFPREMPYGDQKRVEIARALATEPRLLILDEPTQGMVAQEAHKVIDLIRRFAGEGLSLLLIEHNMNVVMTASDQVIVVNFGRKIAEGPPAAVRQNPGVIEAYLGADE